jgi:hypothetical protein
MPASVRTTARTAEFPATVVDQYSAAKGTRLTRACGSPKRRGVDHSQVAAKGTEAPGKGGIDRDGRIRGRQRVRDEGCDLLSTHGGPLVSSGGSFGHVGSARNARLTRCAVWES